MFFLIENINYYLFNVLIMPNEFFYRLYSFGLQVMIIVWFSADYFDFSLLQDLNQIKLFHSFYKFYYHKVIKYFWKNYRYF